MNSIQFGFSGWVAKPTDVRLSSGRRTAAGWRRTLAVQFKRAAVYPACKEAGCDTLVGVSYRYRTQDFFFCKRMSCTATGYPAQVVESLGGGGSRVEYGLCGGD
ncbi:MAG: hypothetical protein LBN38_04560, partial [Verrucomicrobiota bacterium]|nr:hypothetical protein [Verrucomicrobiota bacterium]